MVTCLESSLWTSEMGVVILGMQDSRVKEHLICNTARLDTWITTREELEITRTQQYINAQPAPMQLGATQKGKGKEKGKPKATPPSPRQSPQGETRQTSKPKAKRSRVPVQRRKILPLQEERACEGGLTQTAQGSCIGGRRPVDATTGADSGLSARNTITPQLGALPRVEQSMSMSFLFLATPLNDDAWTRTHSKGHIGIDNCAAATVFPRRYDDDVVDDHDVQPVWLTSATGRQLANGQHPHCMMAATCRSVAMRQTCNTLSTFLP